MAKKNGAIIGYGGMGGWHGDFLCRSDVVNLMGIYDIKPERCAVAEANGIKDTMTIEKVEVEPEIYTLPQTDDGNEGAANWFTAMGDVELDEGPMEFPEGKMSIKTKIMDIYKYSQTYFRK